MHAAPLLCILLLVLAVVTVICKSSGRSSMDIPQLICVLLAVFLINLACGVWLAVLSFMLPAPTTILCTRTLTFLRVGASVRTHRLAVSSAPSCGFACHVFGAWTVDPADR